MKGRVGWLLKHTPAKTIRHAILFQKLIFMLSQKWLKALAVDFAGHSSRRDRRKTRSVSGHVVLTREVLVFSMLETLETRTLLSADPVVIDIASAADGSNPMELANVNGTLFFRANDGTNGYELRKSDGTEAGTTLVKDVFPGAGSSNTSSLANVNGTLFFNADDGTNGAELWKSDGTALGTILVKDINTGGSPNPGSLTNMNGTLFFNANNGTNGYELWRSDGTSTGTTLVKDI